MPMIGIMAAAIIIIVAPALSASRRERKVRAPTRPFGSPTLDIPIYPINRCSFSVPLWAKREKFCSMGMVNDALSMVGYHE